MASEGSAWATEKKAKTAVKRDVSEAMVVRGVLGCFPPVYLFFF